jgi:hypothetical protein
LLFRLKKGKKNKPPDTEARLGNFLCKASPQRGITQVIPDSDSKITPIFLTDILFLLQITFMIYGFYYP